ncbi:MAG: hypothetical protein L6Q57_02750 [Alphaproteobacteria bacterium]|nr:hypothetical protein [Alphaproteobacteria bacterium]
MGDNRVRASHAALEGDERSWVQSPEPGEEENCRCWAEVVPEIVIRKNACKDLLQNLRIERSTLEGLTNDLSKAIAKHNPALKDWQVAVKKYKEILIKYIQDASSVADPSKIGVLGTVAVLVFEYPEVQAAQEKVDAAKDRYIGIQENIAYLQKQIDQVIKEIKKLEKDKTDMKCDELI